MKQILFRILRKEIIRRLKAAHYGAAFINGVLWAFGLGTDINIYIPKTGEK